MKIAVVQHRLRETPAEDAAALLAAARSAAEAGAEFVVMPEVASLHGDDNMERAALFVQLGSVAGQRLFPQLGPDHEEFAGVSAAPDGLDALGVMGLFVGDACMDAAAIALVADQEPLVAILFPRSESDLQAEAVLEVALALSDALCGLVIVCDTAGAEPGAAGHGGSAIVHLGEILAEAGDEDDLLVAEIPVPIAQPEPKEPLPEIPTILQQRLAHHRGARLDMGYLADLSDGDGPR